jgi:hypothetical protein
MHSCGDNDLDVLLLDTGGSQSSRRRKDASSPL